MAKAVPQPSLSPAEVAAETCRARGGDFREEVEAHLAHGYVLATPAAFLMGRACPKGADVSDLTRTWPAEECNAWFVWLGVGRWQGLLRMMPYRLPWLGWYRQGRGWQREHWVQAERLWCYVAD